MVLNFSGRRKRDVLLILSVAIVFVSMLILMVGNSMKQGQSSVVIPVPSRPSAVPLGEALPKGEGLNEMAADGPLRLLVDLDMQLFQIRDERSGLVWSSSPSLDSSSSLSDVAAQTLASPILFTYTTQYAEDTLTASLLSEKVVWQAYRINGGIQVRYDLIDLKIGFTVEYTLQDGGFHVFLPQDGIREEGTAALTSMELLPLFGAARQGEDGYMLIPDGSGALMYFNRVHSFVNRGYEKWIYGDDPIYRMTDAQQAGESIALPLLGTVKKGGAYLLSITAGAEEAKIVVNPPGVYNIDYYRGGMEFAMRKAYRTKLSRSGERLQRIEKSRILGDREIRLDFLSGEDIGYSELAHLASERLLDNVEDAQKPYARDNYLRVRLLMDSQKRNGSWGEKNVVMTTFFEAIRIAEELRQAGISKLAIALKGWQDKGLYANASGSRGADQQFGGNGGLAELLVAMKEREIGITLELNETDAFDKKGIELKSDLVRTPDGTLYSQNPVDPAGRILNDIIWYRFNAEAARSRRPEMLNFLNKLDVRSVDVKRAGDTLSGDYQRKQVMYRWYGLRETDQLLEDYRSVTGSVGVFYGFLYTAGQADRVLDIPLGTSWDDLLDETVPFLQMLYHGKLTYYSAPINRADETDRLLLRAIEYGAIPTFELTYQSTALLANTLDDGLFSGYYAQWISKVKEAYDIWENTIGGLQSYRIIKHGNVAVDVYRTDYENGVSVWVNYGDERYVQGTLTVEPMGYAVRSGGGN